jgi:hypothetical protein
VNVNGAIYYPSGDGSGICYFSDDGGTTPKALDEIVAGDELIWNGSTYWNLTNGTDKVSLDYNA